MVRLSSVRECNVLQDDLYGTFNVSLGCNVLQDDLYVTFIETLHSLTDDKRNIQIIL
jgi:hypothetical protein